MKTTLIFGPMFAGKSKKLIEIFNKYNKDEVVAFKPNLDTRSHTIISRDGLLLDDVYNLDSFDQVLDFKFNSKIRAIFIDEAQFIKLDNFDFETLIEFLKNKDIDLFVSMLDLDYLGNEFPVFSKIKSFFEEKIHLTSVCVICRNIATHTGKYCDDVRVTNNSNIIEIEGDNQKISYKPLCKKDHESNK